MSKPSQHSSNETWISPYLTVIDVDAAVDFYTRAFQFENSEIKPGDDGKGIHAEMIYGGHLIMCGRESAYGSLLKSPKTSGVDSPITLCISCDDVDAFYQKALAQGAKSISAPEDMFYGYRMCRLQDIDNYVWCFMKPAA
ncbi:MAG: VOC family protein [Alphaproteobacteria bacterium]|nr:VOC family protein [Alphaproteobacteria bacterium]